MRFRTRTQEVEAVQWTGDNLEEVQAFAGVPAVQFMDGELEFHFMDECGVYYVLVPMGSWLVQRASDANGVDRYDDDVLSDDELARDYEPIPDLVRTIEDFDALPDDTILVVVESANEAHVQVGELGYPSEAPYWLEHGAVCEVVRLGSKPIGDTSISDRVVVEPKTDSPELEGWIKWDGMDFTALKRDVGYYYYVDKNKQRWVREEHYEPS